MFIKPLGLLILCLKIGRSGVAEGVILSILKLITDFGLLRGSFEMVTLSTEGLVEDDSFLLLKPLDSFHSTESLRSHIQKEQRKEASAASFEIDFERFLPIHIY